MKQKSDEAAQMKFEKKVAAVKAKMSKGQSLLQAAIDVTCSPEKPAPKKLKCAAVKSLSKKKDLHFLFQT